MDEICQKNDEKKKIKACIFEKNNENSLFELRGHDGIKVCDSTYSDKKIKSNNNKFDFEQIDIKLLK
jgi:hypothetical protein